MDIASLPKDFRSLNAIKAQGFEIGRALNNSSSALSPSSGSKQG
jgi:hypothetical protein